MPVPATLIKIIQITGAVYNTYKLAKAATEALSGEANYFDPSGHQTARFHEYDPSKDVGIIGGHWSFESQQIKAEPRGQIAALFTLILNRSEAIGVGATLETTIRVTPKWWSGGAWIELPAGTCVVNLPFGSSTFEGGIQIDARQAFFSTGTQIFDLDIEIISPNDASKWAANPNLFTYHPKPVDNPNDGTNLYLSGNFDYFHFFFE